jgi:hypothetical protein
MHHHKLLIAPYVWKKDKIFNEQSGEFPLRNPSSAGKPRIKFIAGNDIYEGGRHARQRIVEAIKDNLTKHMPSSLGLKFPITIEAEFHVDPRFANWDIGNLWIYDKVFEDVLQDVNLIPNDNILYVTKSGGARFIPVVNNKDRKIVFILREDEDPRTINHVMYDLQNIKPYHFIDDEKELSKLLTTRVLIISLTSNGEAGTIFIEDRVVNISRGKKKIVWGAVRKGLASVFSLVIQQNSSVIISKEVYTTFNQFVEEELRLKGLTIHVYERRNDVHGSPQDAVDKIHT